MNRLLTATLILSLAITGCSKDGAKAPVGQPFELLAGGGSEEHLSARALDTNLTGTVEDLEVAPDGTAYLLIYSSGTALLERIRPDGTRARIDLMPTIDVGNQIAVGPDGSVYVNLGVADEKDAIHRIRPGY